MGATLTQAKNALTVIRGSSKTLALMVTDPDGNVVDLTGGRVIFSVKRLISDAHALILKDSSKGVAQVELTVPKGGQANIYLDPADTQTLNTGEYTFDVWAVLASGARYPVIPPSTFTVAPGVTVLT